MKGVSKEREKEIMKRIKEAGDPENYETSWSDEGVPVSKERKKIKKGKKSKNAGARFELQVRRDLEGKERVVDKWSNNVDLDKGELIPAKRKYNPFSKVMAIGTGFPDFISIKKAAENLYSVIGVEVKTNGVLSKVEKEKCAWYLKKGVFSEIWIARKGEKKGEIVYDDFKEKYGKKFFED
jgi:hypothetical protein